MAKSKESKSKAPNTAGVAGEVTKGNAAAKSKADKDQAGKKKKVAAKKSVAKTGEKEQSLPQKIKQFFREVRIELKKVTWPSRKETLASTSVVLVLVFLIAVYLGAVDIILSKALKLIVN